LVLAALKIVTLGPNPQRQRLLGQINVKAHPGQWRVIEHQQGFTLTTNGLEQTAKFAKISIELAILRANAHIT
jgi:hypothetical protein